MNKKRIFSVKPINKKEDKISQKKLKKEISSTETKDVSEIRVASIVNEMESSYLDYAMSVIVARALPDVRDGLKPVHRRILFAMHKMGLTYKAKYRKCASVVGEVIGKYHPHGDTAVYDALVRLAQDFSSRYELIQGQGNFGSMDGDPPAAMRYTECRMQRISDEMLRDINKDTVDFKPTYDDTRKEPVVLPAAAPNLLLNGQVGIAVGMATNIPPHNLGEVIDACVHLIEKPEADTVDLLKLVKGPDFPTGGILYNQKDITAAYVDGRGGMICRGKAMIEESDKKGFRIIITAITYQTNKADFIAHIANLVRNKKIEGIKNINDESNKEGVRIVIDLKKDAAANKILNQLYKMTDLQKTFHLNMLALVDGIKPQVMNLRTVLDHYLKYRFVVVKRGLEYDLRQAKDREHILEGLKKALDHIDEIVKLIKASKTKEIAHVNLRKRFKFSDKQSTAILEMKLQQLAGLERKKIEDELKAIKRLIASLESILGSNKNLWGEVKKTLLEVKEKYADERRTKVVKGMVGEFSDEDFVQEEKVMVVVTKGGYIKRMAEGIRSQKRGGKGMIGMVTKEEDVVESLITVNTLDDLLFFTNKGRAFKVKAYEIPESKRATKGQALVNFLELKSNEKVTSVLPMPKENGKRFLVMVTRKGMTKRLDMQSLKNIRRSGLIAIGLKEDDLLEWAELTSGQDQVMIVTRKGQSIRFKESDVRVMGRTAAGVKGINLKGDDEVVGVGILPAQVADKECEIFTITEHGYGKSSNLAFYKVQHRSGSGIKAAQLTTKTGRIAGMRMVCPFKSEEENMSAEEVTDAVVISSKGQIIRMPVKDIKRSGRATQGVRLMRMKQGDRVAAVTFV